jgi:starch synthase
MTVSRTYADEIQTTEEFGFGLAGVLRARPVVGIVNGIDEARWCMDGVDYARPAAAVVSTLKRAAREPIFTAWKWPLAGDPVVAFRGRWDHQKGVTLLAACMPDILTRARVVLCTWGIPGEDDRLQGAWDCLQALAAARPDRLQINPTGVSGLQETASHYTVADFFLMPSQYEPCGLAQMEAMRYGTVPIVRRTGGLADTVFEIPRPGIASPNGFVFQRNTPDQLVAAVDRAVDRWTANSLGERIENALRQRNGWATRVPAYEALFG